MDICPPDCPEWCSHDHDGWTMTPTDLAWTCRRVIRCDGDVEVTVEQWAHATRGRIEIEAPRVLIDAPEALAATDVASLAAVLHRVEDLIGLGATLAA